MAPTEIFVSGLLAYGMFPLRVRRMTFGHFYLSICVQVINKSMAITAELTTALPYLSGSLVNN